MACLFPAVILAHGTSRRFAAGGAIADKGLALLGGKPLAAHVAARLAPQCAALAFNAPPGFARLAEAAGAVLLDDGRFAGQGPLAGIRAGLAWAARSYPASSHLLVAPTDMPFLPADLAARLADGLAAGQAAVARAEGGQAIPVLGLWPLAALPEVERALEAGTALAVRAVLERLGGREVAFPPAALMDIDDRAALAAAERRLAREDCESAGRR